jgi:hypothetical protein
VNVNIDILYPRFARINEFIIAIAGNGTDPLQFGNVADIAIGENAIFVADGDGGVNNRVVALSLDFNPTPLFLFGEPGQGPAQFSSPHRYVCTHTHHVGSI